MVVGGSCPGSVLMGGSALAGLGTPAVCQPHLPIPAPPPRTCLLLLSPFTSFRTLPKAQLLSEALASYRHSPERLTVVHTLAATVRIVPLPDIFYCSLIVSGALTLRLSVPKNRN